MATTTMRRTTTYPNLKAIISPTTVGISAAARYLSSNQLTGKVLLTGLGTPNQMRQFVKDGTVSAFTLWNVNDRGDLAYYFYSSSCRARQWGVACLPNSVVVLI